MSTDISQAGSDGVTAAPVPPAAGDKAIADAARRYVAALRAVHQAQQGDLSRATYNACIIAFAGRKEAESALLAAVDAHPEVTT